MESLGCHGCVEVAVAGTQEDGGGGEGELEGSKPLIMG